MRGKLVLHRRFHHQTRGPVSAPTLDVAGLTGDALVSVGRGAEAVLCFRGTFGLDPQRANAAFEAGGLLRESGQHDEALTWFDVSTRVQPDHSPTLQLLALTLDALGRH